VSDESGQKEAEQRAEQRRLEQERQEATRRSDDAHRARGETTRPDEIAGAHGPVSGGLRPGDEEAAARALREADRPAQADIAPLPDTGPQHSVLDELDPEDERRAQMNRVGGIAGTDDYSPATARAQQRQASARWIAYALTFGGIALLLWAFSGGRVESHDVGAVASPAVSPSAPPSTQPPTPTPTPRATVALSAGAIGAMQVGTTTRYTVQNVTGDGLQYDWRHSATCGTHTGVTTATYVWDHPHIPGGCPEEPFHASFITVQITDAGGNAVVRQYTQGSREGLGVVPPGGGVFTPQPTTVVRTTAPASTATTATATGGASVSADLRADKVSYGLNYPLAVAGTGLTLAGASLWLGLRRIKEGGGMEQIDPPDVRLGLPKEKGGGGMEQIDPPVRRDR